MVRRTIPGCAAAVLMVCGTAASTAHGQAIWTGMAGDGLWSTVGNWNPMQLPLMTDTVSIPANTPGCVANVGGTVAGITAQAGLTVRAPITVTGPSSAVNLFIEPGGNILNSSGVPFPVTGVSLINGTLSTDAFSFSGTMTASTLALFNSSVTSTGTSNVQVLLNAGGGTFTNSGMMDFQGEADASGNANVNGLRNTSALKKTGTGTTQIGCKFEQLGGTTTVEGGTLSFANSQTTWSAGTVAVSAGTFKLDTGQHLFAGLSNIAGAGNVEIAASGTIGSPGLQVTQNVDIVCTGVASIAGTVTRIDAELRNNGNLILGANANFLGTGILRNLPMRSILVRGQTSLNSTTLINEGALLGLGGNITLTGSAAIENAAGAVMRIEGNKNINNGGGGTNTVTNHGTFEKTEPGSSVVGPRFRQACGVINVQEGTLALDGGGDFVDDVTVSSVEAGGTLKMGVGSFVFTDAVHVFTGDGVTQFGQTGSVPSFNVHADSGLDLHMDTLGPGHTWLSLCTIGGDGLIQQNGRCYAGGTTLGYNDGGFWTLNFVNEGEFHCANPPGENQSGPNIRGGTFTNNGVVHMTNSIHIRDNAVVTNASRWNAISDLGTTDVMLISTGAIFVNTGIFEKTGLGVTDVNGPFSNEGEVRINLGRLNFNNIGQLQGGVLAGGSTWHAEPGVTLQLSQNCTRLTDDTLFETGSDECTQMRPCALIDDGAALICNNDFVSTASSCSLREGGSLTVEDDSIFQCSGDINNGAIGQSVLAYAQETAVISLGPPPPGLPRIVTPNFNNRAQVRPGGNGAAGPFNLTGSLNCFDESVLQIELGGPVPLSDHDQIAVTGNATIDGTLEVSFLDTFEPQSGDSWVILTATGALSGGFDQIIAPEPPAGAEWRATVASGQIVLRLACRADFDNSGGIGVPDIFAFLSAWFAQSPGADFNSDTVITVPDIFAFLSTWFAGCSS